MAVNSYDCEFKSPLFYSLYFCSYQIVEIFLTRDCDQTVDVKGSQSAINIAKSNNCDKCLELLEKYEKEGTIWTQQRHHLYSSNFKENVLCFLVCVKKATKIPKPLLTIIILNLSRKNK